MVAHRSGPMSINVEDGFEIALGPASRRYFGDGYRRTLYDVTSFGADASAEASVTAVGRIQYPTQWSTKSSGSTAPPHLSTIDAAVLSVRMLEAVLIAHCGLSAAQVGRAWLESLSIRAGTQPVESLSAVLLSSRLVSQTAVEGGHVSSFESRIGSLMVNARIRHEGASERQGDDVEPAAAMDGEGPLTALFRRTTHRTRIQEIDLENRSLQCTHQVMPRDGKASGLESAYWPAVTLIDCLVLAGQMAQVLIYASDSVNRDSTNNLWMRRATFLALPPWQRNLCTDVTMAVTERRTIHRGDRSTHSVAVAVPHLFGIDVTASLAYVGVSKRSAG